MSWHVRPALPADLEQMHALAQLTGPGFTNIPQSHDGLAARVAWSMASYEKADERPGNDLYLLVLEERATGRLGGTALLYAAVGSEWPFYSYLVSEHAQYSKVLGRTISAELLHLVTDNGGASEVGGLFLHPDLRAGGLGRLLARARYMFAAQHRGRFADRFCSELRGWLNEDGQSPFWDAIGRQFFNMDFVEADRFNQSHGNQFIAELMPKYPIYTIMLPDSARAVLGRPHNTGVGAMRMLEREGFHFEGYVDIFDGGPTMNVRTDHIATIRDSRVAPFVGPAEASATPVIAASGRLFDFRAWLDAGERTERGWQLASGAGLPTGKEVRVVPL